MRRLAACCLLLLAAACASTRDQDDGPMPPATPPANTDARLTELQTSLTELLERIDVLNDRMSRLEEARIAPAVVAAPAPSQPAPTPAPQPAAQPAVIEAPAAQGALHNA
ncbi:MAG TPA: hypothetical protein VJ276_12310, partial [Thermoanaerobaculia bacterium]|nr:hypothetical protein [Thermoanaerobaculia bacterium]